MTTPKNQNPAGRPGIGDTKAREVWNGFRYRHYT
jgi:hypothetical protein